MHEDTKVFIGFFRSNFASTSIAQFVHAICRQTTGVRIFTRRLSGDSTVKYCCARFATEGQALHAQKLLTHTEFEGHGLLARPWVERTAANERRNVNWRSIPWAGVERRHGERRHYLGADPSSTDSDISVEELLRPDLAPRRVVGEKDVAGGG